MRRPALAALTLAASAALAISGTTTALAQPSVAPSPPPALAEPAGTPSETPTGAPTSEPTPAPPETEPTPSETAAPAPGPESTETPTASPPPAPRPTPTPPAIVPRPVPAFPAVLNKHGWIVGDSITLQSSPNFRKRFHRFDTTAVSGLRVQELPRFVRARIARGPLPRHVVIALGTNQADTWSADPRGNYQSVVDLIHRARPSAKIIFVTTYRDPRRAHLYTAGNDKTMASYSRAMTQIAAGDPRVCISSWRWWIARNRHHLYDGVHPSFPGRKKWAELLYSAIHTRC